MTCTEYTPCAACHQHCCWNYTVTVTGYDACLIATDWQLALEQFLVYFPASEPQPDNFKLDHSGQVFSMALTKQRADESSGQPCVFWLSLPDGYGRCGIYPVRPLVCQNYPAAISDGLVHLRTDALCPPRSWSLPAMNLPSWRERLLRYQMEYDIYCYLVERWNAAADASPPDTAYPINVYYGYLTAVYARLASVRQAIPAGQEPEILQHWGKYAENHLNPLKHSQDPTHQPASPTWTRFVAGLRQTIETFLAAEEPVSAQAEPDILFKDLPGVSNLVVELAAGSVPQPLTANGSGIQ